MAYEIEFGICRGGIFAVPVRVAEEELKFCTGEQLKVLLLALRLAVSPVDEVYIAGRLGMKPSEVCDCLEYWKSRGLFDTSPAPAAPAQTESSDAEPDSAVLVSETPSDTAQNPAPVVIKRARNKLLPSEINALSTSDPAIPAMLQEFQNLLNRMISPGEQEVIVYLYTFFRLKPDFLLLIAEYCRSHIQKMNEKYGASSRLTMNYFEKVVVSWIDGGYDTHEKAEAHIQELNRREENEELIITLFSLPQNTRLKLKEKDFIETWFTQYQFGTELIQLACQQCIEKIGKISFSLIHDILTEWYQKGIHLPEQAQMELSAVRKRKEAKASAPKSTYDLEEIQRLMLLNSSQ